MRPLLATTAAALGVVVGVALVGCSAADRPEADRPEAAPAETTGSPAGAPTRYDRYVALGDSYTAAPLVPPTDVSTICLRSEVNYPALLAESMPGTELTDVSCSGATTTDTVRPQVGRTGRVPPQFAAIGRGTDLVTIGLGGNDYRLFGGTLGSCVQVASSDPTGSPCTDAATGGRNLDRILARIRGNVADVVRGVEDRAPRARVVVVGYPQIVPESGTCDDLPLATGDYPFARTVNEGLADAVRGAAADSDADYVDLWEPSAGHDICADEPWINGRVTSAETALAYHPLAVEQQAVAGLVLDEIS